MMRSIWFSLVIVFFVGCGVLTDSSNNTYVGPGGGDGNGNDTDSNTSTDTNTSTDDGHIGDSIFDTSDATYDKQACLIDSTYVVMTDSSFDPLSTNDEENGIEISSRYDYNADVEETQVSIFYPELTQNKVGQSVIVYADNVDTYRFGFDQSWVGNENKTVYVMTPKGFTRYYGCYRYELSSLNGTEITSTKVYR